MTKEKAERYTRIYNWARLVIIVLFLLFVLVGAASAQSYMPQLHGILRGKYEYQPQMGASRFEVRNARLSVNGELPLRSEYKLEVDLCDETAIKMKDAWVRVSFPLSYQAGRSPLRLTVGQQRMPFSIDAHRNPAAQYFANRSFIAKQVGDMRDVGAALGYDVPLGPVSAQGNFAPRMKIDAGVYNGSNLTNQKSAWFHSPAYSARIQCFPVRGLAIMPSIQHQLIAERKAAYTSIDLGAYYEKNGWHVEAEYLRKRYAHKAFHPCTAVDAMLIYQHRLRGERGFIESISCQGRYDWMQDHSSGQAGLEEGAPAAGGGQATAHLVLTDAERHRMTLGATFSIRNPYFPTALRLNYEKYWYPHGGAKESEQDKVVCEVMVRF